MTPIDASWDFFAAVRELRRRGTDVRFRGSRSAEFPDRPVAEVSAGPGGRAEVTAAFFALTGPRGEVPAGYADPGGDGGPAVDDLLAVFEDHFINSYYLAWAQYRAAVRYEATGPGGDDPFRRALASLAGGDRRHPFAALFARRARSAEGLEVLLTAACGVPCRVIQFAGGWMEIPPDDRTRLGRTGGNNQVGRSAPLGALLGARVWEPGSAFHVRVGPLDPDGYARFLPGSDGLAGLTELTRAYVGPELAFAVRLVRQAEPPPECRLTAASTGAGARPHRLGWDAWVRARGALTDRDDLVHFPP